MTRCARSGAQPHLDPLAASASHDRHVLELVDVEVRRQLPVDDPQHVAVELGGHARRVVVRAQEPAGVLDQVGAEQERVAGLQRGRTLREQLGPGRADRGCRSSSRGTRSCGARPAGRLPGRARSRRRTARSAARGTAVASAAVASASTVGSTSNGTNSRSVPASRSARSSRPVFSDVPLPSSTSDSRRDRRGDLAGARGQDLALGPGRVVLRQAGDLVEQLAAALVVEVLGRQGLRGRGQAGAHIGAQRRQVPAGPSLDTV